MTKKSKYETLRRKKRRREKLQEDVPDINNLVAKHMNEYNRPKRHADLSKDHSAKDRYQRWRFGEDDDS